MIDLSQYHLKEKYREVLEHLSDDDKIRIAIENYSFDELKDIVIYYDLQDNPLLRTLGFEKYGKSSFSAYEYARDIIKGRWLEAEDTIKTDSEYVACWYTIEVIKGRWLEAEEYIKKDPESAFYYAQYVIKGRWHEAEDIIKTDSEWALEYVRDVIEDANEQQDFWDNPTMIDLSEYHLKEEYREVLEHLSDDDKVKISIENYSFDELKDIVIYYDLQENPLLKTLGLPKYGKDPDYAYKYAKDVIQGRWIEAEEIIKTDPYSAFWYARNVIKGRFPEAEEIIKTNPEYAYSYADQVIKDRWLEAEDVIKTDPRLAYWYASEVIQGRFPEAEEYIKTDAWAAFHYAKYVIKGRFPEAEEYYQNRSLLDVLLFKS